MRQALQNRVTPFGDVVALTGRGSLMGNRGVLHDERRRIVGVSQLKRWITCRLSFRGRHRPLMRAGSYTELFFLDEATAFGAGHRPCAECRNADYKRFLTLWETRSGGRTNAEAIDAVLHAERLDGASKRTYRAPLASLPDGTAIALDGAAWIVNADRLLAWSDLGYRERRTRPTFGEVDVLTPPSIVAIFEAGYVPAIHPANVAADLGLNKISSAS